MVKGQVVGKNVPSGLVIEGQHNCKKLLFKGKLIKN
jgi:hypothetical protein